jgi:undecaprenyl-diphosphatase
MLNFVNYIILGTLQGIFEWIPISSEGVVAVAAQYLKTEANPVDLALFLHAGTLLAAIGYYWRDWLKVITLKDWALIRFLFITAIISLPLGFIVYGFIDRAAMGAGLLAVTGFGLLFTAYFQSRKITFKWSRTKLALVSGILQGLAVIPGFSRSGATIFGLSLGNLEPKEILHLSYLMSVPAVAASTAYMLVFKGETSPTQAWPALAASFVVGLLFLDILTKFASKTNFAKFALAFAVLCFAGVFLEIMPK